MRPARRTYTIEEANALVPQVRAILLQIAVEQHRLEAAHAEMHRQLSEDGDPEAARAASRSEAEVTEISEGIHSLMEHLAALGVQLRDSEMGLVDFPGQRDGKPVWLCWRLADPEVAHWHTSAEGFASRKPW
jgi:hypothetical protein